MFIIRILLGLFLVIMGTNKFMGFMPPIELTTEANSFMIALMETGYMLPMVGIVEIGCGILFLFAATAPLATLLLAPLSMNILLFHIFLDPSTIWPAAAVFSLNVIFGGYYFEYFRSIFARIMEEKVFYRNKTGLDTGHVTATAN